MPAHPHLVLGALALLLAGGCGDGCAACSSEDEPAGEAARTTAEPPEGLLWEVSVGGGSDVLRATAELVPARVRPLVATEPGTVLERLAPHAPASSVVPAGADLHGLALDVGGEDHVVLAARARVADGPEPLGAGVELVAGAPSGGRWIERAPAASAPAALLLGDVLVVGDDPIAVGRAASYLAHVVAAREAKEGVVLRSPGGLLAERWRRAADRAIAAQAGAALETIAAERARHDQPPAHGDPEEVVAALREVAEDVVAFLPDVGETQLWVRPAPAGLAIDLDADVEPGSPLSEALSDATVAPAFGLAALPEDVALAWSVRLAPDEAPSFLAGTLGRVGGSRLDDDARASLRAADEAVGASRGEAIVAAFGGGTEGPWALLGTAPVRAPLDGDALLGALGARWVSDLAGTLLGCAGAVEPSSFDAGDGDGVRRSSLCRGEASPTMTLAATGGAAVVALERGDADVAAAVARRLDAERPRDGFGARPDAARALSALDDRALAAGVLVPSRLWGAAALFDLGPLRGVAREATVAGRPAPLLWALSRTDEGLRLRVVATGTAIEDLSGIVETFVASD